MNIMETLGKQIIARHADVSTTRLRFYKFGIDEYGTTVLEVVGGLNAIAPQGEWVRYFETLSSFAADLCEAFGDAWLISIDNDVPDDVFYAKFGLRKEGGDGE